MMNERQPPVKTNTDTDFLKLVAVICMLADHVGGKFFPQYPIFRWVGRLAFPLFCYCMTVGMLYTRNIKKYLGRLAVFALISQPFYVLAAHPRGFLANLGNLNIFFTLFLSLLSVWGFKERRWWLFAIGVLALGFWNFDYSITGVILMMIFYLCRQKPALGAALFVLSYLPAVFSGAGDPLSPVIAGYAVGFEIFSLLALPLIFLHTNLRPKIPKWAFYAFYPAHLAIIAAVRLAAGI